MKQESKQKKNVGTSVMGNDIETTQNTMHVLDENKVLKKSYEDVYIFLNLLGRPR